MSLAIQKRTGPSVLLPMMLAAFTVTLLLFYIDEGNYSFENLTHPGNIVALSFYFVGMMLSQAVVLAITERFIQNRGAIILSLVLGIPGGIALTILFFTWLRG